MLEFWDEIVIMFNCDDELKVSYVFVVIGWFALAEFMFVGGERADVYVF